MSKASTKKSATATTPELVGGPADIVQNDKHAPSDPRYLFECKTIQSNAFRTLVEALKDILTDTNFEIDDSGIRVLSIDDQSRSIMVHMRLEAENFEKFYCRHKMVVGINLTNLFKLIKLMVNTDNLTMYLTEDDPNIMHICMENPENNTQKTSQLRLIEITARPLDPPALKFPTVITIPSEDFQRTCRDLMNIDETVSIQSKGKALVFRVKPDWGEQDVTLGESKEGIHFDQFTETVTEGRFSLKSLILFTKCTNLNPTMELYLRNNYPLILLYPIASLGSIKLCLAPIREDKKEPSR
jgi:proliferating cell nuclear antigen